LEGRWKDRAAKYVHAHLDERLDLAAACEFLGSHALGDLQRVALDAGDDGVGVGALLGALIKLLDDNDLVACLTALENDGNLISTRVSPGRNIRFKMGTSTCEDGSRGARDEASQYESLQRA
jgi:hypothetical protein